MLRLVFVISFSGIAGLVTVVNAQVMSMQLWTVASGERETVPCTIYAISVPQIQLMFS